MGYVTMRRWFFRRAFRRYQQMEFDDDISRLNELIQLFQRTEWFHTIYESRNGRTVYLPLWYQDAEALLTDLRIWHDALDADVIQEIYLEGKTYAILEPQTSLYYWLADAHGRVIRFSSMMDDIVGYGRVLAVWLDGLKAREDLEARYGIRKTRRITHDCIELLTFAAIRYSGAT